MIPTKDALLTTLSLDLLDERGACYVGPNGTTAAIDRAMFNSQAMPTEVTLVVDIPEAKRIPEKAFTVWEDPVIDPVPEVPDWVHDGQYDIEAVIAYVKAWIAPDIKPHHERLLRRMIIKLPKGTE